MKSRYNCNAINSANDNASANYEAVLEDNIMLNLSIEQLIYTNLKLVVQQFVFSFSDNSDSFNLFDYNVDTFYYDNVSMVQ